MKEDTCHLANKLVDMHIHIRICRAGCGEGGSSIDERKIMGFEMKRKNKFIH